ncbi:uncharacterized protein Z520_08022 [Fonsecaea multimorphosa CBS 102226]|uniref:Diacylglycerol O-acyltransferase n=1 Tax=Fonsecaea multimorphosa CBS 102226 TaxID=1442371 RepID=A0A0D2K037_9EURO|nr:uncharacterized protein Z520_08022 [Fonsecaea multimorphosa CBS 102226]KIX96244.1 hypothetical protein Z520_08022 [Fonsecaea multimorphosa CBS 102226]OAL21907.1 hypothetical protein AYO22_07504 [Fonsecaea multimorphosa]
MESFEKLRPVDRLERYSTARHDLKFYLGPAVTASYRLPKSHSPRLKECIYKALEDVITRHPILSAIPLNENTQNPYFVRLPEIHLDKCVYFQARQRDYDPDSSDGERDVELDELFSTQHRVPYEPPNPFWRLYILTNSVHPSDFTAALFYHHALGDGTSGMAFHRAFHSALSQSVSTLPTELAPASVIPSPSAPLLPSLESLHPLPVSTWHLLTILFKHKIWSSRDPGLWTGAKCTIALGPQTGARHLAFSASSTTAFKNICRANGTTITGALQTLIAGALFAHLPEKYTKLACNGALSARRFLPADAGITDDSMGVYVLDMSDTYMRDRFLQHQHTDSKSGRYDLLPWAEAQRSRENIEQVLGLKGRNAAVGLLRYVNDYQQELFLSKVGKDRDSSFEVSNLGVFKPSSSPPTVVVEEGNAQGVEIGRMVFTQSAGVTASAIQVSAITGPDGCLVLGVTWQKGVVDDELVEKVLRSVEEEVKRLTGTD